MCLCLQGKSVKSRLQEVRSKVEAALMGHKSK